MSKAVPYDGVSDGIEKDLRDRRTTSWGNLSGRHRAEILRHLAVGDMTTGALAKKYGVQRSSVTIFKQRNRREIDDIRARLDDEFAGLWVARKSSRLAELEWQIEIIDSAIRDLDQAGQYDMDLMRVRASLMKQASEELGQLPPRQQVVSAQVTHTVVGVSSDELKAAGLVPGG